MIRVTRFLTLCESESTRTCENCTCFCPCVFWLVQRAKTCYKIWYLGPLPSTLVIVGYGLLLCLLPIRGLMVGNILVHILHIMMKRYAADEQILAKQKNTCIQRQNLKNIIWFSLKHWMKTICFDLFAKDKLACQERKLTLWLACIYTLRN